MTTTSSMPDTVEVAFRGTRHEFTFGFFVDSEQTQPIVPFDASAYPRIQLVDPNGEIVLTRTPPSVRPSSAPGFWAFDFDVPQTATVTAVGQKWEFAAEIVGANGRHTVYRTTFIVKDPTVVKSGNVGRFYATVAGRELTVVYQTTVPVYSIGLDVVNDVGDETNMFLVQSAVVGNSPQNIKYIVSGGLHIYQYTIRAQKTAGFTLQNFIEGGWQAHWTVQETPAHIPDLVYQIIRVFHRGILSYEPEVRFIVDKLEKRLTIRQGYDTSDILGGLQQGLNLVNSVFPHTSWTLLNAPATAKTYIVLGAAWWIIMGQLGLAVDLQFSFSGQRVSLDQDQTGGLSDMLEKYRSMLFEVFKGVKVDLVRQQQAVGWVVTRPQRPFRHTDLSFRTSTDVVNYGTMLFLNNIGIY